MDQKWEWNSPKENLIFPKMGLKWYERIDGMNGAVQWFRIQCKMVFSEKTMVFWIKNRFRGISLNLKTFYDFV